MLFKIGLNIFYSSVIIENEDFIPRNGEPTIICANHSNSIMDAIVLVTSVSRKVPPPLIVSGLKEEPEDVTEYGKGYNCQRQGNLELAHSTKYLPPLLVGEGWVDG